MNTLRLGGPPDIPQICDGPGESGLVSILIPSFNRGYILGEALKSVLAQTYRRIEVIVVDDGSTDNTREVVSQFGSEVRYIYQENAGLAVARNTGLAAARGEFVAFQDSDDMWMPWKLKAQVALLRKIPEIALVWTEMTAVDPKGVFVREKHLSTMYDVYRKIQIEDYLPHSGRMKEILPDCSPELSDQLFRYGDIFSAMFMGNLVHPPTAVMRRSALQKTGGLDLTFSRTCEDYEFFWRVSLHGLGAVIEAPGMLYRVEAVDQLTKPAGHLFIARGNLYALKRHLDQNRERIKLPNGMIRHHMAEAYSWVGEEELQSDHGDGAASLLFKSLRLNPIQVRALSLFPFSLVPHPIFKAARFLKQRLTGTHS